MSSGEAVSQDPLSYLLMTYNSILLPQYPLFCQACTTLNYSYWLLKYSSAVMPDVPGTVSPPTPGPARQQLMVVSFSWGYQFWCGVW